jgi:hypothetical protein
LSILIRSAHRREPADETHAPVGATVSDAEALAELDLPDGESAVEVPMSMFSLLGMEVVANAQ